MSQFLVELSRNEPSVMIELRLPQGLTPVRHFGKQVLIMLILNANKQLCYDLHTCILTQGLKEFVKYEIPGIPLKSIPTKPIGQDRKIRNPHLSCNSIWMHHEHKVQICTIFTDAFVEKWEVVADIKSEKAVKQKSKLTIFCCMLKFDRNFTDGSLGQSHTH